MGADSKIQWTGNTWNPWHGCIKVSPGCKFCYMYRDKERYGQDPTDVVRSKNNFNDPLKWKEPKLIFTCSWSDWFIEQADPWREEAWKIIKNTPHHTYQILTKRADRIKKCLPANWGDGYPNVWLGVSTEGDYHAATDRILELRDIPASVKFISFEPLIRDLYERYVLNVDWIIIGGESGNETGNYRYRKCSLKWIEGIIKTYRWMQPDTAIFVKQLGTHLAKELKLKDRHGGDMSEWPEHLRIREMPKVYHPV